MLVHQRVLQVPWFLHTEFFGGSQAGLIDDALHQVRWSLKSLLNRGVSAAGFLEEIDAYVSQLSIVSGIEIV